MTGIRIAQPSDDDLVAQLLIRTFSHLYAAMDVKMSPAREAYLKDQAARRAFATAFVCEIAGEVVGTVTLVPPCPDSEAWISGAWDLRLLAVDPRMQGRGIAGALIEAAEQSASAAGATMMCLHARRGVANQARFYLAGNYVRDPAGDLDTEPFQEGYRKSL
ncbi:MAG: GNAT family N-acetyltransferase [Candidatus Sphingomonas colombiensis]|nr:GNAT family N-acetyltransferase [Sphingomonas sp.]WEK41678.1 MAG: GNAT family N-acetyltransferase [Sphingomonas sp.]